MIDFVFLLVKSNINFIQFSNDYFRIFKQKTIKN